MAWLDVCNRFLAQYRISHLAAEIAERSHATVWEKTHKQAIAMRLPEAQGYVRARAIAVIHAHAMRALADAELIDRSLRSELIERATGAVVDSVTHDLLKSPRRFAGRRLAA